MFVNLDRVEYGALDVRQNDETACTLAEQRMHASRVAFARDGDPGRPRTASAMPFSRIRRSTVRRVTSWPCRAACWVGTRQTGSTPVKRSRRPSGSLISGSVGD
ncbi:hypothetical protein AADR41_02050 [Streptomyces sp. CLV115]|uniref:hypothetical protein n=1 Tax=Streptomyces sp. CLV115 TaxID=3138502 RepID=UPI00313B82BC